MLTPQSIFPTRCECSEPGWCPRHRWQKSRFWFELCRRCPRWFNLWEKQGGPLPGQSAAVPARDACRHLGPEIRRQNCPTCLGHVELKIFACAVHKECIVSLKLPDLACCQTCDDYAGRSDGLLPAKSQHALSQPASPPMTPSPSPLGRGPG